ncbi:MAG TPA: CehA/McbA family metallohydrolase, partial [Pirellulales bacterium]|nr:CehA/McbA family metallohydrolase [Pirellulales bacterium]
KPAVKGSTSAAATSEEPWVKLADDRWCHRFAQVDARGGGQLLFCNLRHSVVAGSSASENRSALDLVLQAREQPGAWIDVARAFSWDLPLWIAHGMVDSIELANSHLGRGSVQADEAGGKPRDKQAYPNPTGNGRWNAAIYYHLLNCGLRIPPSAGSGSGDAPNPVGYNRAYVHVDGEFTPEKWWQGLRAGQVVVTNGPLLRPSVQGELPGHVFQAGAGDELELEIGLTLSTRETVHYLEIIKDGKVAQSIRLADYVQQGGRLPKLKFKESGWFLIRAVTDTPGTYRFASSGPYYVQVGYTPRVSRASVQFFLDWLNERAATLKIEDPAQLAAVTKQYGEARDYWEKLLAKANSE